jgi:hypothetical protein
MPQCIAFSGMSQQQPRSRSTRPSGSSPSQYQVSYTNNEVRTVRSLVPELITAKGKEGISPALQLRPHLNFNLNLKPSQPYHPFPHTANSGTGKDPHKAASLSPPLPSTVPAEHLFMRGFYRTCTIPFLPRITHISTTDHHDSSRSPL